MIVKEDTQIIEDIFKVLDKAKFDGLDANQILQFSLSMKKLAQLQKKLQDIVDKPEVKVEPIQPKKKKESK